MQNFDYDRFKKSLAPMALSQREKEKLAEVTRLIAPQSEQTYPSDFYDVQGTVAKIAKKTGHDQTQTLASIVDDPSILYKFHNLSTMDSLRPEFNKERAIAAVSPALRLQLTRKHPSDRAARITPMTIEMMRVAPNDRVAPEDRKTVHIIGDDGSRLSTRNTRLVAPK